VTTPIDSQFRSLPLPSRGVEHCYGERVCLHSFPYPVSLLTRLSSPETTQPLFNLLLTELYQFLVGKVASLELAQVHVEQPTRMQPINPEGIIRGSIIDPHQKVIVVDVARAGIMPAQIFFDRLCTLLDAGAVRQDHIFMQRVANERGEVTGVDLSGSKIGGPVNERLVIIPDPMGATGSSMIRTMNHYRERSEGRPTRFVCVNLIVTPQYVKRLINEAPDVTIHAVRLDRGLSPQEVLDRAPGELWDQENGLNAEDYIVPGAGGVGELINNALF
jgi:uracil phosphoribosyltransferase